MGRNRDQKARRRNAPGVARNLQREQQANDPGAEPVDEENPEWAIDCPKCGVIAGYACETPSGAKAQKTHVARLK